VNRMKGKRAVRPMSGGGELGGPSISSRSIPHRRSTRRNVLLGARQKEVRNSAAHSAPRDA
jgi:hypothetical protein